MATGVLPLLVGKGTLCSKYLINHRIDIPTENTPNCQECFLNYFLDTKVSFPIGDFPFPSFIYFTCEFSFPFLGVFVILRTGVASIPIRLLPKVMNCVGSVWGSFDTIYLNFGVSYVLRLSMKYFGLAIKSKFRKSSLDLGIDWMLVLLVRRDFKGLCLIYSFCLWGERVICTFLKLICY